MRRWLDVACIGATAGIAYLVGMPDTGSTALIAGAAAILGGGLTAISTRQVEVLRLRAAVRDKAEERELEAMTRFYTAAFAWFEWLNFIEQFELLADEKTLNENNRRSKERQEAYRQLQLLCSDELYKWLAEVYEPLERRVRQEIAEPIRWGKRLPQDAIELRRQYTTMLYRTLVDHFRPELFSLRNPDFGLRWPRLARSRTTVRPGRP